MMRKYLFMWIALFATTATWADSIVLRSGTTDHVVNAISAGSTYSLYKDEPSGDGTSESAPMTVYIPTGNTSVTNQNEYFYLYRSGGQTPLDVASTNRTSNAIIFPLRINTTSTAKYITAAVKVGGTYIVAGQSLTNYSNNTDTDIDFNMSPYEFCSTYPFSSGTNNPCSSSSAYSVDMTVFFYLTSSSIAQGTTFDSSSASTGLYFTLKFSNRISTVTIAIDTPKVGDRRLTLPYTSSAAFATPRAVLVYDFDGSFPSIPSAGETVGSQTTGGLRSKETAYAQNGEVVVTDLTNSTKYVLSLTFIDMYGFTSLLAPEVSATPLEIQELLKKQACFLLTAGFGEEHYVISYFRHFRDTVLAESFLGRMFIHNYYKYAPKYALMIYKHDSIRALIRGAAYTLYFIFNYYLAILIVLIIGASSIYLYKNKDKIKI
jgi:hypothetical protein